jgi:hypothetical protein
VDRRTDWVVSADGRAAPRRRHAVRDRLTGRTPPPLRRPLLPPYARRPPDGPALGAPFALKQWERELFDEALSVDDEGHRLYQFVVLVIPRKCGKTAISSLVALYMLSPADGEHRPEVILAAGFLKQTAKLWDSATAFINDPRYGSPRGGAGFSTRPTSA